MYTKITFLHAVRDFKMFGIELHQMKRITKQEFNQLRNPVRIKHEESNPITCQAFVDTDRTSR